MSDTITNPGAELAPQRRKRGLIGFLGVATLIVSLGTAAAVVFTINEVESEFALSNCLMKVEGADGTLLGNDPASGYYINFDATASQIDPVTGVVTLQEKLDVVVPSGHRTQAYDVFRIDATDCGTDFNVNLKADEAQNTLAENTIDGVWGDKGVQMFLGAEKLAGLGDATTADFDEATAWDQTPLVVARGTAVGSPATNGLTGSSLLEDNSQLAVGFDFIADANAPASTLDGGTTSGVFRFQVVLTPTGSVLNPPPAV